MIHYSFMLKFRTRTSILVQSTVGFFMPEAQRPQTGVARFLGPIP